MFIGYQNDKIAFVSETKEELENMPCVTLDKIEETDKEYFLYNGEYVCEVPVPTKEEQQQARQEAYKAEVDPITCHIQRLGDEEQTPEVIAEIAALVEERKAKVEEIKARYPYPVEDTVSVDEIVNDQVNDQVSDQVDDKLSPVDTVNDTVSELEK